MAKPNYNFAKRQRELKKAQKQEEKRLKKLAGRTSDADDAEQDDAVSTEDTPTQPEQGS